MDKHALTHTYTHTYTNAHTHIQTHTHTHTMMWQQLYCTSFQTPVNHQHVISEGMTEHQPFNWRFSL